MGDNVPPPVKVPPPWRADEPDEPVTGVNLPAVGRWFPHPALVVFVASVVAGLWSLLDVLSADVVTTKVMLIAFAKGVVGWFVSYLGMRSAGPVLGRSKRDG